jgi:arylsulfatase A
MTQILLKIVLGVTAVIAASTEPTTRPTTRPIHQSDDGTILLHARDVTIHGTTVRYEPQPNKNTIGYWTRKEDWVSWDFEVTHGGQFDVIILQGCGKGSGGSEVAFAVGDQALKTTVKDTGGFQNFVERNIGPIELKPGVQTLTIKPLTKPGLAVMDLRSVTLRPITR